MQWYLTVVLICISLQSKQCNVEHLFMCLFAICISSLLRCLFRSLAHLLVVVFIIVEF